MSLRKGKGIIMKCCEERKKREALGGKALEGSVVSTSDNYLPIDLGRPIM